MFRRRPLTAGRCPLWVKSRHLHCTRPDLLNDLRVLIRRCRIKAALKTSRDNGIELRVRHTLVQLGMSALGQ